MTETPQRAESARGVEKLTADERAVVEMFAVHLRRAQTCIMPIGEILRDATGQNRINLWAAIRSLGERGWLVANTTLHWDEQHECVLVGDALRLAQSLASEREPERKLEPPPRSELPETSAPPPLPSIPNIPGTANQ